MQVENYIAELNEPLKSLAFQLHGFLLSTIPNVQYTIKWKVPFYSYYGNLCYINPKKQHLILGFYQGARIANESGILVGNGSLVRHVIIKNTQDIYQASLLDIIQEAIILDELHYSKKGRK